MSILLFQLHWLFSMSRTAGRAVSDCWLVRNDKNHTQHWPYRTSMDDTQCRALFHWIISRQTKHMLIQKTMPEKIMARLAKIIPIIPAGRAHVSNPSSPGNIVDH